jgi:hypothetical protein
MPDGGVSAVIRWLLPLAAALAGAVWLLRVPGEHVRFRDALAGFRDSTVRIGAVDSAQVPVLRRDCTTAGGDTVCTAVREQVTFERNRRVDIRYPRQMRTDESAVVELRYAVGGIPEGAVPDGSRGDRDRTVSLSGANFTIKPEETRRAAWRGRDTVLVTWSALPERTGAHNLIVDAGNLYGEGQPTLTVFDADDRRLREVRSDQIALPVDVFNVWGVSERTAQLLRALVALGVFLLTFVGFKELRRWARARR